MGAYNKSFAAIMVGAGITAAMYLVKVFAPETYAVLNDDTFKGAIYTLLLGTVVLLVPNATKEP
jgi:hypothetical protein